MNTTAKKLQVLIFLAVLLPNYSFAEIVILKCVLSNGMDGGELRIDVDKGIFKHGMMDHDIVHQDDDYITAYQRPGGRGGEVFMINRNTGEFHRGAVGLYYTRGNVSGSGTFGSSTYSGLCTKKQF
jgi:hypothetical protein